jgi:hypothetical protein
MIPNRFLITPVRNETALLPKFLEHHAPLFEHIVVVDQMSSDGSFEIANAHPKVVALRNPSGHYDERVRRELLLDEVRRRDPSGFVVGLDADEFLLTEPAQWVAVCHGLVRDHAGATIRFSWNVLDADRAHWFVLEQAFCVPQLGGELKPGFIHVPRVPLREASHFCGDVPILHLNLLWPKRQRMKVCWYAAMEAVERGRFSLASHRLYLRTGAGLYPNRQPVPERFRAMIDHIVEGLDTGDSDEGWHKKEILRLFESHPAALRHAAIWSRDWVPDLLAAGLPAHSGPSWQARFASRWVALTHRARRTATVRFADAALERILSCKD